MLSIGITGGIGSGKSTLAKLLNCLGFPVYIADERARFLSDTNQEIRTGILAHFGESVFEGTKLNRVALAKRVFGNTSELAALNALIHPVVQADYALWFKAQKSDLVFSEIAILFETNRHLDFDYSIVITASIETRIERVKSRSGLNEEEIRARMAQQLPEDEKIKLADYYIVNENNTAISPQLASILKHLKNSL